eukprot:COSAG01_NODE_12718_length_1694_cov_16.680878_3_plen_42_part_01
MARGLTSLHIYMAAHFERFVRPDLQINIITRGAVAKLPDRYG